MAGLIRENFKEEVLTELSWIMTAIDDLSSKLNLETYETTLIKHRVQPEEERAIQKFFVFHVQELDNFTTKDVLAAIAADYLSTTQKTWSLPGNVVETLIRLRRQQLGL